MIVLYILAAIALFLLIVGVISACAAKAITGKWPHQSKESARVYNAIAGAAIKESDKP